MVNSDLYCPICRSVPTGDARLKEDDPCPVCGGSLLPTYADSPLEDSEEHEQEMFFLGYEEFFDGLV